MPRKAVVAVLDTNYTLGAELNGPAYVGMDPKDLKQKAADAAAAATAAAITPPSVEEGKETAERLYKPRKCYRFMY